MRSTPADQGATQTFAIRTVDAASGSGPGYTWTRTGTGTYVYVFQGIRYIKSATASSPLQALLANVTVSGVQVTVVTYNTNGGVVTSSNHSLAVEAVV